MEARVAGARGRLQALISTLSSITASAHLERRKGASDRAKTALCNTTGRTAEHPSVALHGAEKQMFENAKERLLTLPA